MENFMKKEKKKKEKNEKKRKKRKKKEKKGKKKTFCGAIVNCLTQFTKKLEIFKDNNLEKKKKVFFFN